MEYVEVGVKSPVEEDADIQWSRLLHDHDRHQWCILRPSQLFMEFLCSSISGGATSSPTSAAHGGICPLHPNTDVVLEFE